MTRIGIALSADRVSAVVNGEWWERPLRPHAAGTATWPDLATALAELRAAVRVGRPTLVVAVMPPLAQVKQVELPRLGDEELRRTLARDAERYFTGVRPPRAVYVAPLSRGRQSPARYLVSAADEDAIAAVFAAAEEARWTVGRVVAAHAAWEVAARRRWPALRRGDGHLVLQGDFGIAALEFRGGVVTLVRRFRDAADPAIAAAVTGDALPLAVAHAAQVRAAGFMPEAVRQARRARSTRIARRLLAGTATLVLLAAGLELWGRHRELAVLREHRATLRANVTEAMRLREAIDGIDRRLHALAAAEQRAARWSAAIATVAERLPSDAHLVSLRGTGDTLVLEGIARRAVDAFESFQRAPGVTGVRAEAPIRQEARDTQPPIERFTLGARLGDTP